MGGTRIIFFWVHVRLTGSLNRGPSYVSGTNRSFPGNYSDVALFSDTYSAQLERSKVNQTKTGKNQFLATDYGWLHTLDHDIEKIKIVYPVSVLNFTAC